MRKIRPLFSHLQYVQMKYDILVLGSGPGGYVTAIRASQLGKKVAVVEREALGGICLNWGCIPTKALLKSANVFEYIEHAEDYGIKVAQPKVYFGGMVKRSRGVADGMSKGVQFLMKKNKEHKIEMLTKLFMAGTMKEKMVMRIKVEGREAGMLITIKVGEEERRKQNLNIIKWEVVKRKLERREVELVVKVKKIALGIKCVYQEEHRI